MRGLSLAGLACLASLATLADAAPASYAQRPEVLAFIDEMVRERGFDAKALRRLFAQVEYQPKVIELISRPVLAPPKWYEFAPRFLAPERVDAGVAFWRAHEHALALAEQEFGVAPEIIVAIIGVETYYGRYTGAYRVLDALTTLAFDYPRRADFFRGELKQFLLLARDERIPPLEPRGSYAGAMGLPQFMPSSIRAYALDYDADGKVDLAYDVLQKLDAGVSERQPLAQWQADGVDAFDSFEGLAPDPVGLLMLEEEGGPSYWIVFNNWFVITRYNRSRLYASAVAELAQALKEAARNTP